LAFLHFIFISLLQKIHYVIAQQNVQQMVRRGKLPIRLGYLPGKLKQMNRKEYNLVDFLNI